ncbi:MAG: nucleotidyltransferase family protein [Acidobacteriota bacterium]|nr:nucleotidyltransferase family protein [Acidobacteriota bacterium]
MKSPVEVLGQVAHLLDQLGIPYMIVGSIASSLYGDARATADVDIVVELQAEHIPQLHVALEKDFYVDEQAMRRAVQSRRLFNAIHFDSLFKVDVYVARSDAFTQEQFTRRRQEKLLPDSEQTFALASPEDTLLAKLRWHRQGGAVSARQITDAAGILKVQDERMDRTYLREWADRLGVGDLLEQILNDAR